MVNVMDDTFESKFSWTSHNHFVEVGSSTSKTQNRFGYLSNTNTCPSFATGVASSTTMNGTASFGLTVAKPCPKMNNNMEPGYVLQ